METEALADWLRNDLLPGVLILLGGVLLLRLINWVESLYQRDINARIVAAIATDDVASERLKRSRAVVRAVAWSLSALVVIAAFSFSVNVMGMPLASLVAPATVVAVAIGFGAQQVVGDLPAGFFLLAERQFGYGDVIRFAEPGDDGGVTGTVEELTMRVTKLRTVKGELVIIPNGSLRQVTNLSKDWSRAVVDLPIAMDEDLHHATEVLRDTAGLHRAAGDGVRRARGALPADLRPRGSTRADRGGTGDDRGCRLVIAPTPFRPG